MTPVSLDELVNQPHPLDAQLPPGVLRRRRAALTATRDCVAYAIEVLALDLEVLNRHATAGDGLDAVVDDLPDLLARDWDGGTWPCSIDVAATIAAETTRLLDLHHEMVGSELDDLNVTRSILSRVQLMRHSLIEQRHRLEREITQTKERLLREYVAGTASADDWLA